MGVTSSAPLPAHEAQSKTAQQPGSVVAHQSNNVSRADILCVNNGHVRIREHDNQTGFTIVPLPQQLSLKKPAKTSFSSNTALSQAVRNGKHWAVLLSQRGTVLVVPAHSQWASIAQAANEASDAEWHDMWRVVNACRASLQSTYGGYFYIETHGLVVPHLHFRIVRRPDCVYGLRFHKSVPRTFRPFIMTYANLRTGWCGRFECKIVDVTDEPPNPVKKDAPIYVDIHMAPDPVIVSRFGHESQGLSISEVPVALQQTPNGPKAGTTTFNTTNWNSVPDAFDGHLNQYREYLVQHELGHALFHITKHDSPEEKNAKGVCPVMYQQTRGTGPTQCVTGVDNHPHLLGPKPGDPKTLAWLQTLVE